MTSKRLILRLSSLGDVILATSSLQTSQSSRTFDWVILKDYADLIQHHPQIQHLWAYDRGSGFQGWVQLCRQLWEARYDEVCDLHGSLRTQLMRLLFLSWSFRERRAMPLWSGISKERHRLLPYYILKAFWPKALRPSPWVVRAAKLVGGTGQERPNLAHLLSSPDVPMGAWSGKKYICVMPSSHWKGKKWPVDHYHRVLQQLSYFPVILGAKTDAESFELCRKLQAAGIPHFSGVGLWNLRQTAQILKGSQGYLGGDTGIAHLAEAVGVPAKVIFGPTQPDMGFGPWRSDSQAIGSSLWCRPCGKDGRACFRVSQKFLCLKTLSPEVVLKAMDNPGPDTLGAR